MSQVHYEVYLRKPGAPSWTLEQATEERTRAVEEKELLAREEIEKARIANQRAVDTARIASERGKSRALRAA